MSMNEKAAKEQVPCYILSALEDLTYDVGVLSEMLFMIASAGADIGDIPSCDTSEFEN